MSLKKHFVLSVLLFCGLRLACADVIQLKDQAAVTGKILAEKPDSVVVDVGYTVLVVPRSAIAGITKIRQRRAHTDGRRHPTRSPASTPRRNFIIPTPRSAPRAT